MNFLPRLGKKTVSPELKGNHFQDQIKTFFLSDAFITSLCYGGYENLIVKRFSQNENILRENPGFIGPLNKSLYSLSDAIIHEGLPDQFLEDLLTEALNKAAQNIIKITINASKFLTPIPGKTAIGAMEIAHMLPTIQKLFAWGFGNYLFEKTDVDKIEWGPGEIPADYVALFPPRETLQSICNFCKYPSETGSSSLQNKVSHLTNSVYN